jgi:aminopeptidase N
LLRVDSYDVALDFTRGAESFGSVSSIRFECAEPGAASHVDLVAETVHEITLNGKPLDPAAVWANGRITLPALAGHNRLRVMAECAYTSSGTGMHRSADRGTYVYGKLAQAYARTAYACFDQPDLKAEFTFQVRAPAHWAVLSNQPLRSSARSAGDSRTVRFFSTPRLPTFTTTVVAGDYHVVTAVHTTPDGQEIPLELACRAGLAGDLDAQALFGLAGQGLDFYTGWLGARYPYAKYGQVFVPELSCLASEDAGCVLVSERLLFRSGTSTATDELRTDVLLHEMAHMWFGDLATEQWWDDLWLSESFAEFCGCHARVRLGLYPGAWSVFSVSGKTPGFAQDQLPSAHPVASSAATVSEAIANFDGISYAKGAAVLRQLAAFVGEESFTAGLRDYVARHAYGNARLTDLVAAMAAASGKDLTAWSRAWLETAGPNTLRCEFRAGAAGLLTDFEIVQEAPERFPVLRPHHVTVGLYERSGDGLVRTRRTEVDVAGARTEVPALTGVPQPDLVLLNDDDTGYVIVRFDPRSLDTVLSSVGDLRDPAARAVCWNAVIDLVCQAKLAVPAFTAMLARGMRSEPSDSVLRALHAQAELILTRLAGPGQAAAGKRLLADVAGQALGSPGSPGSRQRAWIDLLSWTATSADQLGLINAILDGGTVIPGLVPDSELRWSILGRLAAAGRADDARIDAELARDPSDSGRRNAAACRAAVPDERHKEAAWRLLTEGRPGPETVSAVARGLMQPEHASLLAGYAERYLAEIPEIWQTRDGHMRVQLANVLFPYPAVSPDVLALIEEFLASPGDPGIARILSDHHDTAQRALRLRSLPP